MLLIETVATVLGTVVAGGQAAVATGLAPPALLAGLVCISNGQRRVSCRRGLGVEEIRCRRVHCQRGSVHEEEPAGVEATGQTCGRQERNCPEGREELDGTIDWGESRPAGCGSHGHSY